MESTENHYENFKKEYFELKGTLRGCPTLEQYKTAYLREQDLIDKMVRDKKKL
jgi:hypothetical protein